MAKVMAQEPPGGTVGPQALLVIEKLLVWAADSEGEDLERLAAGIGQGGCLRTGTLSEHQGGWMEYRCGGRGIFAWPDGGRCVRQ